MIISGSAGMPNHTTLLGRQVRTEEICVGNLWASHEEASTLSRRQQNKQQEQCSYIRKQKKLQINVCFWVTAHPPLPNLTLTLASRFGQNVRFGKGQVGSSPETYIDPKLQNQRASRIIRTKLIARLALLHILRTNFNGPIFQLAELIFFKASTSY